MGLIQGAQKKQKGNNFKLKKRWRFWRLFKQRVLFNRVGKQFKSFRNFFDNKRIIWRHICSLYGKDIKAKVFGEQKKNNRLNNKFFKFLAKLEMRFNIVALRMHLVPTIEIANELIYNGLLKINGVKKKKKNLVQIGDYIQRESSVFITKVTHKQTNRATHFCSHKKWRFFRFYHKRRNRVRFSYFWVIKKSLAVNYLLLNYKVYLGIVLRQPYIGEIVINKQRQLVAWQMVKKIYLLY